MKLNINSKELLALYNVLYMRYEGGEFLHKTDGEDVYLHQIYGRVKACILSALNGDNNASTFEAFLTKEQEKIDKLNVDLHEVRKEQTEIARDLSSVELPKPDEYDLPDYPRRGNRGGNRRGGKR